jgi:hypothetical protein
MPIMTQCLLQGKSVSIEEALTMREDAERRNVAMPLFLCDECGQPVRPHNAGGAARAHFEHHVRNPDCPNSSRSRAGANCQTRQSDLENTSVEHIRALLSNDPEQVRAALQLEVTQLDEELVEIESQLGVEGVENEAANAECQKAASELQVLEEAYQRAVEKSELERANWTQHDFDAVVYERKRALADLEEKKRELQKAEKRRQEAELQLARTEAQLKMAREDRDKLMSQLHLGAFDREKVEAPFRQGEYYTIRDIARETKRTPDLVNHAYNTLLNEDDFKNDAAKEPSLNGKPMKFPARLARRIAWEAWTRLRRNRGKSTAKGASAGK